MPSTDRQQAISDIGQALAIDAGDEVQFDAASITHEEIFAETDFPGIRLLVEAEAASTKRALQIDIGFGDPIPFGPVPTTLETELGAIETLAPRPEVGFAWKLHGLVEKEGQGWRAKDLADLWLMNQYVGLG